MRYKRFHQPNSLEKANYLQMRRIIESYVNFVGYGKDSWAALINENQNAPTYYVKYSFIATINDESHKVSALDNAYYQKIINEQPQKLFTTFASIFKSIGKEHYEMMMDEQLLNQSWKGLLLTLVLRQAG
ncbi:MAG: hypothetical protein RI981_1591 [Bacteroidota bacterium]|jgi:hypothetical protein